jgi:membrane protease YdiL (CAAX protease family)
MAIREIKLKHAIAVLLSLEVLAFISYINADYLALVVQGLSKNQLILVNYLTPLLILICWLVFFRKSWGLTEIGIRSTEGKYWVAAVLIALLAVGLNYVHVVVLYAGHAESINAVMSNVGFLEYFSTNIIPFSPEDLLIIFLVKCVLGPLNEELIYRGILQHGLSNTTLRQAGIWIIVSGFWSAGHWIQGWDWFLQYFFEGILLSWLVYKSNSILPALLAHCLRNFIWEASSLTIYSNYL